MNTYSSRVIASLAMSTLSLLPLQSAAATTACTDPAGNAVACAAAADPAAVTATRPSLATTAGTPVGDPHAAPVHGAHEPPSPAPPLVTAATPTPPDTDAAASAALPPISEAERRAAFAPVQAHAMHDDDIHGLAWFNRLEAFNDNHGVNGQLWEARAWVGSDLNRVWLRSDGERAAGRLEHADAEVFYGRAIAPWWDALIGLRHEVGTGPSRTSLAFGVVGLAPYKFDLELTGYVASGGHAAARFEAEYTTYLAGRLILQPLLETTWYARRDPARGQGRGLDNASLGLRLRYELNRQFAPYVGYEWVNRFGDSAALARANGEPVRGARWVAGVRIWF
jgi:copper resistance protein B